MARSDAVELWSVSHCTAHGAWRDFVPGVAESRSCRRYEYVCVRVWGRLAEGSRHRPTTPRALGSGTLCLCRAHGKSLGVMRCVVWSLVCWARPVKRSGRSELARSPRAHRVLLHTHLQLTWSLNSNSTPLPLSFFYVRSRPPDGNERRREIFCRSFLSTPHSSRSPGRHNHVFALEIGRIEKMAGQNHHGPVHSMPAAPTSSSFRM